MRISDWSSDVCSSDLGFGGGGRRRTRAARAFGTAAERERRGAADHLGAAARAPAPIGLFEHDRAEAARSLFRRPDARRLWPAFAPRSSRDGRARRLSRAWRSERHTFELQTPINNSLSAL